MLSKVSVFEIKDAILSDCPVGNICNIEYWSGFDESRKQNGEGAGFTFRLKWGHPTGDIHPSAWILISDALHQGGTKTQRTKWKT